MTEYWIQINKLDCFLTSSFLISSDAINYSCMLLEIDYKIWLRAWIVESA